MNDSRSWFARGTCTCGFNVVVTQVSKRSEYDYHWFCTNVDCENHKGDDLPDNEHPVWFIHSKVKEK